MSRTELTVHRGSYTSSLLPHAKHRAGVYLAVRRDAFLWEEKILLFNDTSGQRALRLFYGTVSRNKLLLTVYKREDKCFKQDFIC